MMEDRVREGWVVVVVDRETLGGDWEALGGGELVAVPHEGKRTCSAKTDDSYASRSMSRLQKPFHSWDSWWGPFC